MSEDGVHWIERPGQGLTPCRWSYPRWMWRALLATDAPLRNGNLASGGCPHGCRYCYVPSLPHPKDDEPPMPDELPPELRERELELRVVRRRTGLDALLRGIKRAGRELHFPPAVVAASTGDALATQLVGDYRQVFAACAEAGLPLVILTKGDVGDPAALFPDQAGEGFALAFGATVTCRDAVAATVEPGAPPPSVRLAGLRRVAEWARTVPYRVATWASITPIHALTGPVGPLVRWVLEEARPGLVAAEVLHGRNSWCRKHATREAPAVLAADLLREGARAGVPVALKDELHEAASTGPLRLAHHAMAWQALHAAGWREDLESDGLFWDMSERPRFRPGEWIPPESRQEVLSW